MTIGERIRSIRQSKGISQTELANVTGITKQNLYKYETNIITNIPSDKIEAISRYLDVSPALIMGWEEYPKTINKKSVPNGFSKMPETELRPRVGRIACGDPITAEENIEAYDEVLSSWHADFTLMCCGNSMSPKIEDGDIVAIRSQPTVENGEIAAVRIGDEATLKRVFLHPDYIELRPINPEYESIIRRKEEMEDIKIEGRAVGLCRNL